MIDLTPIIEAVIALLAALITAYAVPWLKAKLGEKKFNEMKGWVVIAVNAAEQIYDGVGRGEEKKAHVLAFLKSKGYTIDAAEIDNLIESAVLELNKSIQ